MALKKYKQKRNFSHTPEPEGKVSGRNKKLRFVIQKHNATQLHYDFRLEMGGVLKSWAVPKGPSLNPADKRLAIMVEDHPVEYMKFRGIIPEGNYGAGEVEIWDEGSYQCSEPSEIQEEQQLLDELQDGHLKFTLSGNILHGEFALVKMKGPQRENQWLLIKKDDAYAVHKKYNSNSVSPVKPLPKKSLNALRKKPSATPKKKTTAVLESTVQRKVKKKSLKK